MDAEVTLLLMEENLVPKKGVFYESRIAFNPLA